MSKQARFKSDDMTASPRLDEKPLSSFSGSASAFTTRSESLLSTGTLFNKLMRRSFS